MAASANDHAALYEQAVTAACAAVDATGRHDRGLSGSAWVEVHPANSSFARWLAANHLGLRARRGVWVSRCDDYQGQSVDVALAGAQAFADVLTRGGVKAFANSRID